MLTMHLPVGDSCTYGSDLTCYFRRALVVESASRSSAEQLFGPLGVKIVCDHRFLGGSLVALWLEARSFVLGKIHQWALDIKNLSRVAISQPQTAYSALVKSLQQEWIYLCRVVLDCCSLFAELEETLLSSFLPVMFGCEISSLEQRLFSLPLRLGGLGLDLPTVSANSLNAASRYATEVIVSAIISATPFEPSVHDDLLKDITGSNLILTMRRGFLRFVLNWILFTGVLLNMLGPMIYLHGCLSCPFKRTTMI